MVVVDWLIANAGSIAVGFAVLAIVVSVIVYKVLDSKKGNSSCGCGCESCAMAGKCHPKKSDQE